MTHVHHIKDNGCCKSQRLFSCANDHSRMNKTYGMGRVILLCEDNGKLKETEEFLKDVYGEDNVTDCCTLDDFLSFSKHQMRSLEAIYLEPFQSNPKIISDLIKLARISRSNLNKIVTVDDSFKRRGI